MSVSLRCKTSLNKRKNQNSNLIVMSKETPNFLKMLRCTLQAGFNHSGKSLQKKDVNDAFTKVWGRNKQALKRAGGRNNEESDEN